MAIITNVNEKDYAIIKCCEKFIKRFKINSLLRRANATKEKGVPAYEVFAFLMGLVFTGKNFYTALATAKEKVPFGKDVIYRFYKKATINWNMFLLRLSISVVSEVDILTSEDRRTAIIFDDTPYYRNRSKKVELLSRFKDHSKNCYYKGYNLLNMGWSDGQTFIPLDFRVLAHTEDEKLLEGSHVVEDNRTIATKRRKDAQTEKPKLVLEMLKSVKGTQAEAEYVLFDSWFSPPSAILSVSGLGFKVVTRLKNHKNYRYEYNGELFSINEIYAKCPKRRGKSRYLLSVTVNVRHKDFEKSVPAKIVFIRDRNNRKRWIALLSTDVDLSEDDIIALYGKRWDIEPFHKMIKSGLRLEKEFQFRSYDAVVAHTAIVLARYVMLSLENRENKDERSVCALYFHFCQELEDISFAYSFELILNTFKQWVSEYIFLGNDTIDILVDEFIALLPLFIKDKLKLSMCES